MGARKTTDLWVITPNELGALAKLTMPFKTNNINIESFVCWEEKNNAHFRLVTSNNKKAKELCTQAGYTVKEEPIILWTTSNAPGRLNAATTALAEAKINTSCTYACSTGPGETTVAFYTNNPDRTREILNKLG